MSVSSSDTHLRLRRPRPRHRSNRAVQAHCSQVPGSVWWERLQATFFQAGIQDESMRDHRALHTGRGVKGLHCRHHRRFRDHRDSTFALPQHLCACSLCQLSVRKTRQQKSTSTRSAGCEPAPPMKSRFSRASQAVSCREVSQSRLSKTCQAGFAVCGFLALFSGQGDWNVPFQFPLSQKRDAAKYVNMCCASCCNVRTWNVSIICLTLRLASVRIPSSVPCSHCLFIA